MTNPAESLRKDQAGRWMAPVAMMLAGAALFAAVVLDVQHQGKLAQWDRVLPPWLHQHTTPAAIVLASGLSRMGGGEVDCAIVLCLCVPLVKRKRWRLVTVLLGAMIGSGFFNGVLKGYFAMPRPSHWTFHPFGPEDGYTFPSGHTMGAAITAGLIVLLHNHLVAAGTRRRLLLAGAAALVALVEAAALVYVGVHYITDVVAALGVSLAWLGVLRMLLPPRPGAAGRLESVLPEPVEQTP